MTGESGAGESGAGESMTGVSGTSTSVSAGADSASLPSVLRYSRHTIVAPSNQNGICHAIATRNDVRS